jgi:hypothetical protein
MAMGDNAKIIASQSRSQPMERNNIPAHCTGKRDTHMQILEK